MFCLFFFNFIPINAGNNKKFVSVNTAKKITGSYKRIIIGMMDNVDRSAPLMNVIRYELPNFNGQTTDLVWCI